MNTAEVIRQAHGEATRALEVIRGCDDKRIRAAYERLVLEAIVNAHAMGETDVASLIRVGLKRIIQGL